MKDVTSMLRRIDEEIVGHKQAIIRAQVEIARLQDTRLVLMRLVEDDQAALEQDRTERIGTINGEHARPVLIVRREGAADPLGDEDGSESLRRKTGIDPDREAERREKDRIRHPKNRDARKAEPKHSPEQREKWRIKSAEQRAARGAGARGAQPNSNSASGLFKEKVLDLLKGDPEGMTVQEMGNHLGIVAGERNRKSLANAVFRLKATGKLRQDKPGGPYRLA